MPLTYSFIFPTHKLELLEKDSTSYSLYYLTESGTIISIDNLEVSSRSKNIIDFKNNILSILDNDIPDINKELITTFLVNTDKQKIKTSIDADANCKTNIGFIIDKNCIYYIETNSEEISIYEFVKCKIINRDRCENLEEIITRESQRLGTTIYSCKLVFQDNKQSIILQDRISVKTIKYNKRSNESMALPTMVIDNSIVTTKNITHEDNVELTITLKYLNSPEAHLRKRQSFIDDFHRDGLLVENDQRSFFMKTQDSGTYATQSAIKKYIIDKIIEINPSISMNLLELFFIGPSAQEYPILLAPPSIFHCVGSRLLRFKFSNDHITFSWIFIGIHQKYLVEDNELSKSLATLIAAIDLNHHDLSPQHTGNIIKQLFENAAKSPEIIPYLKKLTGIQTTAKLYYQDGDLIAKDSSTRIVFSDGIRSDEKDNLLFSEEPNQFPMNYTLSISKKDILSLNQPHQIEAENQMRSYLNRETETIPYIENSLILRDPEGFDDKVVTNFVPHKKDKYMLKLSSVTKDDTQEILKLITSTGQIDSLFHNPVAYLEERSDIFKMIENLRHAFIIQVLGESEENIVTTIKTIEIPYYETKEYPIYISTLSIWSTKFSDCIKITSGNLDIVTTLITRLRIEECTKKEDDRPIWDFDALNKILISCKIDDFFYIQHVSYDGQVTSDTTPEENLKQQLFKNTPPLFQDFFRQATNTVNGEIPQENQFINFFSNIGSAVGQKFIEKSHKLNAYFFKSQYNKFSITGDLAIPEGSSNIKDVEDIKKLFNTIPRLNSSQVEKLVEVTKRQNELSGNPAILNINFS